MVLIGVAGVRAEEIERNVLFRAGEGGYASYRIPAIVAVGEKGVLAFCEGRKNNGGDSGEINLLERRSADGGRTFGPVQVVWADGANTCGNPCAVVDEATGVVWLLMTHNLGEDREPGLTMGTSKKTRTVWVTSSKDGGKTWEKPQEITKEVKKEEWAWFATGPGVGVQIHTGKYKGRLVIPCDYVTRGGKMGNSVVFYSDDHGQSWKIGGEPAGGGYNESQVVELNGGEVMLNMRNGRVKKGTTQPKERGVAVSEDGGETFAAARHDTALVEPICQGSILRYSWGKNGVILFANPASTKREKMTVRESRDEGQTWSDGRVVWDGPAAYSCLVKLQDGQVGLLYEAGEKKPYERIELARFGMGE
jgi:sialidase-1